jgi:hypothetical protein
VLNGNALARAKLATIALYLLGPFLYGTLSISQQDRFGLMFSLISSIPEIRPFYPAENDASPGAAPDKCRLCYLANLLVLFLIHRYEKDELQCLGTLCVRDAHQKSSEMASQANSWH